MRCSTPWKLFLESWDPHMFWNLELENHLQALEILVAPLDSLEPMGTQMDLAATGRKLPLEFASNRVEIQTFRNWS